MNSPTGRENLTFLRQYFLIEIEVALQDPLPEASGLNRDYMSVGNLFVIIRLKPLSTTHPKYLARFLLNS